MAARGWVRRWAVGVCTALVAVSVAVPSAQAQVSGAGPVAAVPEDELPPGGPQESPPAAVEVPEGYPGTNQARAGERRDTPAADGELVGRRTGHSRTYVQPDGSYRTVLAALPLNFKNGKGELAKIDTSLVKAPAAAAPTAFLTAAGPAALSVPARADGPARVSSVDGSWVQTRLLGAVGAPAASGSTATVADALPGVAVG